MKRSIFMDPKRADDPDVIAAYEADREILRKHANFEELEVLARQYTVIKQQLENTPSGKAARRRVLRHKLRSTEAAIKHWRFLSGC
jgi:uncharacterized protein (DUF2252 family)